MSIGICFGSSKYDSDAVGDYLTICEQSDRIKQLTQTIRRYQELEIKVKHLTGFDFETLKDLFAMGYCLTAPKHTSSPEITEWRIKHE